METKLGLSVADFQTVKNRQDLLTLINEKNAVCKKVKKTIPTVKRNIDLVINNTNLEYQLNLNAPKETEAIIGIPKKGKTIKKIYLNGNSIWSKGRIKKKAAGVTFVSKNANYLKFKVSSGVKNIKAIYKK